MKNKKLNYLILFGFILILFTMFGSNSTGDNVVGFSLIFTVLGFLLTNFITVHFDEPEKIALPQLLKKVLSVFLLHVFYLVAITLIFAGIFAPELLKNIVWQLLAAVGSATNYWSIAHNLSGDFASNAGLFFHTWPLSVGVQYLFVGILGLSLCRKLVGSSKKTFKLVVLILSGIGAVTAIVLLLVQPTVKSNADIAYFSSLSYLFSFAIGSGVSCLTTQRKLFLKKNVDLELNLVSLPIMLVILGLAVLISHQFGMWHFVAIVGTSLLTGFLLRIISYENRTNTPINNVKINLLLLKVYLFVWPLYLIFSVKYAGVKAIVLASLFSLALACGFTLFEKIVGSPWRLNANQNNKGSLVTTFAIILVGVTSILTVPFVNGPLAAQSTEATTKTKEKTTDTEKEKTTTSSSKTATETSAEKAELAKVTQKEKLMSTWQSMMQKTTSKVDIAVYSPTTGEVYELSNQTAGTTYDTASIVKVSILGALLQKTQSGETSLTQSDQYLATDMITQSSNDAATSILNNRLGGYAGLQPFFDSIGMSHSTVDTWAWGITQTTAADQVTLLKNIFYPSTFFTDDSRNYMQSLMGEVGEDQNWGISAGAEKFAIKNGWLNNDDGTWTINSIGRVSSSTNADGYVIAVLTGNDESEQGGINLVEQFSSATTSIMMN